MRIRQRMICWLHFNQPSINADTSFGEFTVVGPPSDALCLSLGAELAEEVSLGLLLELTVPQKETELWVFRRLLLRWQQAQRPIRYQEESAHMRALIKLHKAFLS